jgi:hypothetical protein
VANVPSGPSLTPPHKIIKKKQTLGEHFNRDISIERERERERERESARGKKHQFNPIKLRNFPAVPVQGFTVTFTT